MSRMNKPISGFSLVELAILLLVVGMVGGMSMSAGQTILKAGDVNATKQQLGIIRSALLLFRDKTGRFPCPARENDVMSSATYGVEGANCATTAIAGITTSGNAGIGFVPYKALGLNQSVSMDTWGNKFTYAVDMIHTVSSNVGPGSLIVVDASGNSLTQSPTMGKPIFALISHGEDGNGAYLSDSATQTACGATSKDKENCNNNATFMDDRPSQSSIAANYYDDFVVWYSQMYDPLLFNIKKVEVNSLAMGTFYTCLTKTGGTLWCWGYNSTGQVGDGTSVAKTVPTQVSGGGIWKSLNTSASSTCGIKSDDTLWCWGENVYGQVGDGTIVNKTVPTQVSGGGTWKQQSLYTTSCGIKSDNTLWCWGYNNYGRVGDGTTVNKTIPTQVSGAGTWKSIYGAGLVLCGIKMDDTLWCWGYNASGQVGDGTTVHKNVPTQVSGGGMWKNIYNNNNSVCGIKLDDTLWCWGQNMWGQVGIGTSINKTAPTQVNGGGTWKGVVWSLTWMCGIKSDDTLWCWGSNGSGEAGVGTTTLKITAPTQISGGGTWKGVYLGKASSCGIKMDDTLWCWGFNFYGSVGDGTSVDKTAPTRVSGNGAWKSVILSTTDDRICSIKNDDTLWCWGNNSINQVGDGTLVNRTVPTQVSGNGTWKSAYVRYDSTCGIKTDDTLWCWGISGYGQAGNGMTLSASVPIPVAW
jgi:alpha-tubulin suppressor-like RCC1 family protein/type II secretory pathway pseudopilin PulG